MGETLTDAASTTRYIGRYAKRPAMAESRIREYDGKTVTFEYTDKVEKVHKMKQLSVHAFFALLVRHIHDTHFRAIRYAGILSARTKRRDSALARAFLRRTKRPAPIPLSWRERRIRENGDDPLVCRHCGSILVLTEVWYHARDGPLKRRW